MNDLNLSKPLIEPDAFLTISKANNTFIQNSMNITKNISFFNSELQDQQVIQYSVNSLYDSLVIYGLIISSGDKNLTLEELGSFMGQDSVIGQGFGTSVSLSADGNTLAVGGCGLVDLGTFIYPIYSYTDAAVWIYKRINGSWFLDSPIIYGIGSGSSLSLSGNGNILAIGTYGINSVFIYSKINNIWTLSQTLVNVFNTISPEVIGISVSLSGDGMTLSIGSDLQEIPICNYVYKNMNNVWIYEDGFNPNFNMSGSGYQQKTPSCISYDGKTIAVASYGANQNKGQIAIYIKNSSGNWVQQGGFLGNRTISDREGFSIALSSNGDILVTGSIKGSLSDGKAYYYTRTNGIWSSGTELIVDDLLNSRFGSSVSISGDGKSIAVGGINDGLGIGAVWLFYKKDDGYLFSEKIRGSDESAYSLRGYSTSISNDGKTMVFSGIDYSSKGAVWIYISPTIPTNEEVLPSTNKIFFNDSYFNNVNTNILETETLMVKNKISFFGVKQTEKLNCSRNIGSILKILKLYGFASSNDFWKLRDTPLIGTNGYNPVTSLSAKQGFSVALSYNGETAIVGGIETNNLTTLGSVWIYIKIKGIWSQQAGPLYNTSGPGTSLQGYSVSLSSNGNYAAVGAPSDGADLGVGAVFVYVRNGNLWSLQTTPSLIPSGVTNNTHIGRSVSISNEGNILLVGGEGNILVPPNNGGNVWIYNRIGNIWNLVDGPIQPVGVVSFGTSCALSGNGLTFVVGDPDYNGTGAIWIYENTTPGIPGGWVNTAGPLTSMTSMGNDSNQGISVCISGDGTTVGVGSSVDYNNRGACYIYFKNNNTWILQAGPLVGSASTSICSQGTSVSISSDGNTFITGGPRNNSESGAVWTFRRIDGIWSQEGSQVSHNTENSINFGQSVAISANGENILIGAINIDNSGGAYPGFL
jgi:hypothetical protein